MAKRNKVVFVSYFVIPLTPDKGSWCGINYLDESGKEHVRWHDNITHSSAARLVRAVERKTYGNQHWKLFPEANGWSAMLRRQE